MRTQGAVDGAESLTVNGDLGGGAGSDTFIVTAGLNNHNGADTFALNGNLIGGAGANTFSVTDSGLATNSVSLNGVLEGSRNDQGDVFEFAGLYQTVHLASGSSTSTGTGDTYELSGALQGTFVITAPEQLNRTDTLDFSTLTSGVNVNLGSTAAQTVAPGLILQLSNANGFSNVIGTANNDTIYGNARTNLLQGADALDSSYNPNAPGVAPTASCRSCFWISTRLTIKPTASSISTRSMPPKASRRCTSIRRRNARPSCRPSRPIMLPSWPSSTPQGN